MRVVKHGPENGIVTLEATATAREVGEALENARTEFAYNMRIRPESGKTLDTLASEKLGIADLDSAVAAQAVHLLVPFAIDKHDLRPISQPQVESDGPLLRGRPFKFSAKVKVKPHIELESYEPVSIEVEPFAFDESEVDERLAHIVDRFVDFVPAPAHPVEQGDHCYIRMNALVDGAPEPRLSTDGRVYSLGRGYLPESFDAGLLGMEAGQTKTIEFDAPRFGHEGENARYVCSVTLVGLRERVVGELADEWVEEHVEGFDTLEALRSATAEQVEAEQREAYDSEVKNKVVAKFSEGFSGEIPEEAFEETFNAVLDNLKASVTMNGDNFVEYVNNMGGEEQVEYAVGMRAKQAIEQDYALDSLFERLGLAIERQDELSAACELSPNDPQGAIERMKATGRGFALREVAARHRAARWLMDHSTVTTR